MSERPSLTVACLCAEWCRLCDAYREVFEATPARTGVGGRYLWVDIEDEEDIVGDIDVQNFPTVLVARGAEVLFFGTLLPHESHLDRLLKRAAGGELEPLADAQAGALLQRLVARVAS